MWLALPPVDLWPLAWIAPVPWLILVERERLAGRHPYRTLWLAGFVFWLAALHWLRLPHWATGIGGLALAFYLSFYLPLFVALTRLAVKRWNVSIVLAAPVVWTGLELARAHVLTGFTMASLCHTQYRWTQLIQISDLAGGYAVSFVVMLAAACLTRMLPLDGSRRVTWWPLWPAGAVVAATLTYGHFRLQAPASGRPTVNVALIQESYDTRFDLPPGSNPAKEMHDKYYDLTRSAISPESPVDLVVWPETMFGYPQGLIDESRLTGISESDLASLRVQCQTSQFGLQETHRQLNAGRPTPWNWLVGIDTWRHYGEQGQVEIERFNSALLVDSAGRPQGRYDKMHPVVFGEYVPLGKWFPWLYKLTPMAGGIETGEGPQSLLIGGLRFSPSICYETVIPHLIRGQVAVLRAKNEEPDVLVNLTNDGWFWGSSELDMHLACGVFRAVECRKPLLIAANTGFSAHIDGAGRILQQGPRHAAGSILATVAADTRHSPYVSWGDWPAGICLLSCAALALSGVLQRTAGEEIKSPSA